jgi:hypothetical protein
MAAGKQSNFEIEEYPDARTDKIPFRKIEQGRPCEATFDICVSFGFSLTMVRKIHALPNAESLI